MDYARYLFNIWHFRQEMRRILRCVFFCGKAQTDSDHAMLGIKIDDTSGIVHLHDDDSTLGVIGLFRLPSRVTAMRLIRFLIGKLNLVQEHQDEL